MNKNLLRLLLCLFILPVALFGDPSVSNSPTLDNKLVLYVGKGTVGTRLTCVFTNTNGAVRYFQVHDSATLPADTAVPKLSIAVAAGGSYVLDIPWSCTNGIVICNSTTVATKTIGAADAYITGYTTASLHPL